MLSVCYVKLSSPLVWKKNNLVSEFWATYGFSRLIEAKVASTGFLS